MAVDPHTVYIHRPKNLVENISRNRVAKKNRPTSGFHFEASTCNYRSFLYFGFNHSLSALHLCSHGSTLNEEDANGTPASFDDSSTPLHVVKYYCALNWAKFSKQPEYVISRIVKGPKQIYVGPEYCVRCNKYDSNNDT